MATIFGSVLIHFSCQDFNLEWRDETRNELKNDRKLAGVSNAVSCKFDYSSSVNIVIQRLSGFPLSHRSDELQFQPFNIRPC